MKAPTLFEKSAAEFLGTFMLVFVGAGTVIASSYVGAAGPASLILIALAFGLALAIAVTMMMGISGGHINPAVTLGFLSIGRIKARDAAYYIVSQVAGATVAGVALMLLLPFGAGSSFGATSLAPQVSVVQGIGIEAVITFLLVLSVFVTAVDKRTLRSVRIGGFGIGLTLAALILIAGPFTGGAANPARAAGPLLAQMIIPQSYSLVPPFISEWYVYWIGPVVGGILAALAYKHLLLRKR